MEAERITNRDRVTDDLATVKEELAGAQCVIDRSVQILARHLRKDSPRAIDAREDLYKLTQLGTRVQPDSGSVLSMFLPDIRVREVSHGD